MIAPRPDAQRLLSREFALLIVAGTFAMIGFGSTLPLVPRFVESELRGDKVAVGVAIGIFAVSAVFARPFIGKLGDDRGRRFLIVSGCALTGVCVAAHGLATSLPMLYGIRLAMGASQGAFFVGTATLVSDLAPPERRGEAINYFSIAVYSGLAFGPLLGELTQHAAGFGWAFVAGGASLGVAALLATGLPARVPRAGGDAGQRAGGLAGLIHMPAVAPGIVMMMGVIPFTALNAFMPLYVDEYDLGSAGAVLLVYGLVVLFMRVAGSKIPDRWGTRRSATVALVGQTAGVLLMGVWASTAGLFAGAVILGVGGSFLYPALLTSAVHEVPEETRARATSTFTVFFELSSGFGGPALGVAAAIGGIRWAFVVAAAFAALGLPILREWGRRRPDAMVPPRVEVHP